MTPPIQLLDPQQSEKFPSLKIYAQTCREEAEKTGKGAEAFDLKQAFVANRTPGDGIFNILGNNPEKDFFCSAEINWRNHEMLIKSGQLSLKNGKPVGALWMSDACSMTKTVAGEDEVGKLNCEDGQVDPRMAAISQMESVQFYLKTCDTALTAKGREHGMDWSGKVIPSRVFLENPTLKDGIYSLKFASGAYDFICEGHVDTLEHKMTIVTGDADKKTRNPIKVVKEEDLNDACTLTRKSLGEEELVGECKDRTERERMIETGMEWTWKGLMTGLAVRDVYRFIRKRPTLMGKAWRTIRHPITTAKNIGESLSRAGTAVRGFPALLARTGTALRGFGGLRAAGFLGRIPGFLGGGAAGGGGTGVAAGGGTVAGAGAGATAGVVVAGLAIGVGIGILIEKTPRWLGSKYSVSDGIAWGIDSGVGLLAGAASLVSSSKKEDIKRSITRFNIDALDHMGFGGWNAFKQSWGI